MKKIFTIIIFICAFTILFVICKLHKPILSGDYIKINKGPESNICLSNKKEIDVFVEYVDKMYKRKTLKWKDVCQSPDILITLTRKNGIKERIDIYGCFMHYKGKQYVINYDEFYEKWIQKN